MTADIGFLLPPLKAVERGSKVVHAAPMVDVPLPDGETFRAPHLVAYCGVRGWGDAGTGPATCKRCLHALTEMHGGVDVNEAAFQTRVIEAAKLMGWMVVHFRPAKQRGRWVTAYTGDDGFPDLVLARAGRVLLVELKAEDGRFRPGQREWLEAAGDNGKLWRPSNWDEVLEVLK